MSASPLDLDAIEARVTAATFAPWQRTFGHDDDENGYAVTGGGEPGTMPERLIAYTLDWPMSEQQAAADAYFIAHAREDVPALVAEARRLRTAIAEARS